jgi:hypothetical protein
VKTVSSKGLLKDLRELIEAARQDVARQVNSALVLLYWRMVKRIRQDILEEKRAEYGEQIVYAVSAQLVKEFGTGFSEKNLRRMVQFAEGFPDEGIVVTLSRQLGWSHFVAIIPLDDDLKRDFYAEMCRIERRCTRTLEKKKGLANFAPFLEGWQKKIRPSAQAGQHCLPPSTRSTCPVI